MMGLLEQATRRRTFTARFPAHPGRWQAVDLKFWAVETPATAANLRE